MQLNLARDQAVRNRQHRASGWSPSNRRCIVPRPTPTTRGLVMTSERIDGDSNPIGQKRSRKFLLRDPGEAPRGARRKRLMMRAVSIVLAGVMGTVTTRFLIAQWATAQSYSRWMMNDLERLVEAQSEFHAEYGRFASKGELGVTFVPSQAVYITIVAADQTGWYAYANHLRSTDRCVVTVGTGASVLRNVPSAKPTCGIP